MKGIAALLAAALLIGWATPTRAAPDDLDASFGDAGSVVVDRAAESPILALVPLPDGGMLALDITGTVRRVTAEGRVDMTFAGGAGVFRIRSVCGNCGASGIAIQPDGKILLALFYASPYFVARLTRDGLLDPSFGENGLASLVGAYPGENFFPDVMIQPDGAIVAAGSAEDLSRLRSYVLARFDGSGKPDRGFGDRGVVSVPADAQSAAALRTADAKFVIAGRRFPLAQPAVPEVRTVIARLLANGEMDTSFGANGVFLDLAFAPRALAEQRDGKLVIAGSVVVDGLEQFAVMRLDALGRRDPTFGSHGLVVVPIEPNHSSVATSVSVDSRARIVVAGTIEEGPSVSSPRMRRIAVVRLDASGSADITFAGAGVTTFWQGFSSSAFGVLVTPADAIVVGGDAEDEPRYAIMGLYIRFTRPALFKLEGGEGTHQRPLREGRAIEYFHAHFGHYFVSTLPREIMKLDLTAWYGWQRTGRTFRVWPAFAPDLVEVCRFYSDQSFAPKSSHFYTPYAEECALIERDPVWLRERDDVFRFRLPSGPANARDCPSGSAPLYRAYNNGAGGAPNHRYTAVAAVLDKMIAQGWSFEGEQQTRVFACIPP